MSKFIMFADEILNLEDAYVIQKLPSGVRIIFQRFEASEMNMNKLDAEKRFEQLKKILEVEEENKNNDEFKILHEKINKRVDDFKIFENEISVKNDHMRGFCEGVMSELEYIKKIIVQILTYK